MARRRNPEAWAYLTEELKPDIALLQEVLPSVASHASQIAQSSSPLLFHPISETRRWGSAIYARSLPLTEIELESYHGWVIAGELKLPDESDLIAVSVHVQIIKGYVFPHLTDIFSQLEERFRGRRFIVGGDLNASRQFDRVYGSKTHGEFFERVEHLSFFECHRKFHAEEQQSFWGSRYKNKYQIDHLFISDNLKDKLISCEVLNDERVRGLSDHSPLIAQLEINWQTD